MLSILEERLNDLLKSFYTVAVVCNQFGDSGKGKIVDLISTYWKPHYCVRSSGADNAGHTIKFGETTLATHIIPSGIIHDKDGVRNIIARGTAINPKTARDELVALDACGITHNGLGISLNAKLILPQHILLDRLRESRSGKIGTTGRGVGPVFSDHFARIGLTVGDMLNKDVFLKKIIKNMEEKTIIFNSYDPKLVKEIMNLKVLENGLFYDPIKLVNIDAIIFYYCSYFADFFRGMIYDTEKELKGVVGKEKILLEGAQGIMLDVDEGTRPFVTSSNCSPAGLAHGAGLKGEDVDFTFGVTKAPYMTRVGEGSFPTEIGGLNAVSRFKGVLEDHAAELEKATEVDLLNSKNEIIQAGTICTKGHEFGVTTGRPRRVGWLDLVSLKHAVSISGKNICITKPDVLTGCKEIKICIGYVYQGPDYNYGNRVIRNGEEIYDIILKEEILEKCRPIYKIFPGWEEDVSKIRRYEDLPVQLRDIFCFTKEYIRTQTEQKIEAEIFIVSVGADRDQTIIV